MNFKPCRLRSAPPTMEHAMGWELPVPRQQKRTIEHPPDWPLPITCRIDLLWYACLACNLATSLI